MKELVFISSLLFVLLTSGIAQKNIPIEEVPEGVWGDYQELRRNEYELTIQLNGNEEISKMHLLRGKGDIFASSEAKDGVFKFSGILDEPQLCVVFSDKYPYKRKVFILDYGKTKIITDPSKLAEAEISFEFDKNNKLMEQFQKLFREFGDNRRATYIPDLRKAERENNQEKIDLCIEKLDSLFLDMKNNIYEFVESNSDKHGVAVVIAEELMQTNFLDPEELLKVYNLYSESIKKSIYGNKLKEYIDELNNPVLCTGKQIVDFTMDDIDGSEVSIKEFRNKYVLIDFWASWCGPCRADNPNLVKAYEKYKSEGFEIVGISLDTNKDAWLKAIEKDELSWTNLTDLKGWQNDLAQHYKIKGVPTNILLDRDGKIIEINLRGKRLLEKLNVIFEK